MPCLVCHERFPALTAEHLRTHGLTVSAYERLHSPSLSPAPPAAPRAAPGEPRAAGLLDDDARRRLASHLASDPDFIFRLADETMDVLATGPIRDRVRLATGAVIESRIALQGTALAQLRRAYEKLSEPWRLEQSPDGKDPVTTRELLTIVQTLGTEVARGEDLIMRAARVVLEEQRTRLAAGLTTVAQVDRFVPQENLPLPPPDTTPEGRENLRILFSMMPRLAADPGAMKAVQRRLSAPPIDVAASAPSAAPTPDGDSPPSPPPLPPHDRAPMEVIRERVRALTTRPQNPSPPPSTGAPSFPPERREPAQGGGSGRASSLALEKDDL